MVRKKMQEKLKAQILQIFSPGCIVFNPEMQCKAFELRSSKELKFRGQETGQQLSTGELPCLLCTKITSTKIKHLNSQLLSPVEPKIY